MGFKDLFKHLPDNMGSDRLTEDEVIEFLELNEEQISQLRNTELIHECLEVNKTNAGETAEIDVEFIVGLNCRNGDRDIDNWYDMLMKLHKQTCCIQNKSVGELKKYLENMGTLNLPEVLQTKSGDYFINGDGKHRLTIAKCLRIDKVKVNLFEVDD